MREDLSNWEEEIDRELSEAELEFDETADARLKEYEAKLKDWKEIHCKKPFQSHI